MRFNAVVAVAAAAMLAVGAQAASAQIVSCTGNGCLTTNTGTLTVNDVMQLDLSGVSTALGTPGLTNFNAGKITSTGPTAKVWSNRPYRVTVAAAAANFTYTGSLSGSKPASDLQWNTTGTGSYTALSTTAADLFSGTSNAGSTVGGIFYNTLLSYANDLPGSYALVVNFTLAAP
jgi:hypothetical protein